MGKVHVWLKRTYVAVATVIGASSALMLAFTLFSHGHHHQDEEVDKLLPGLSAMYAFAILTLLCAVVGVFGACREKKWALILFAVGMILSSLLILFCVIVGLAGRTQIAEDIKTHFPHLEMNSNSSASLLKEFKATQAAFQCCGVEQGYVEWGYDIPESCVCAEKPTNPCVAAPRNSSLFEEHSVDEPIMIYQEPCLQHVIDYMFDLVTVVLAIMLGVVILWLVAVALCIIILCRLSQKVETPPVVYSQEAKAGNYTILADPDNLT